MPEESRAATLLRQADEHYEKAMELLDEVGNMDLTDAEVLELWPIAMRLKANLERWRV